MHSNLKPNAMVQQIEWSYIYFSNGNDINSLYISELSNYYCFCTSQNIYFKNAYSFKNV